MFSAFARGGAGGGKGLGECAEALVHGNHGTRGIGSYLEADGGQPAAVEHETEFDMARNGARRDRDARKAGGVRDEIITEFEDLLDALDLKMLAMRFLEIEAGGGTFARGANGGEQGVTGGPKKVFETEDFALVFGGGNDFLARAQTAAHFAVNAAGMIGRDVEILLAAADLEQVEHFGFESFGGGASAEWSEVKTLRRGEPGGDLRARVGVGQEKSDVRREAQSDESGVVLGEVRAGGFIESEVRSEAGGREGVFDTGGEKVEVEEARGSGGLSEDAIQAAAEASGATEQGAGAAGVDDINGRDIGDFVQMKRGFKDGRMHAGLLLPLKDAEPVAGGRGRIGSYGEVFADMRGLAHAGESGGDAGGGAGELQRELGVGLRGGPPGAEASRKAVDESGLVQGGAGDNGDAGAGGDFEHINSLAVEQGMRVCEGLGHGEVERELDEAEVVVFASGVAREFDETGEREAFVLAGLQAEGVPGGDAVVANVARGTKLFEALEGVGDPVLELGEGNGAELSFGVVEVEDVDGIEAEVGAGTGSLVAEEFGLDAMGVRHDMGGMEVGGDGAGGEETGFGADEDFVARGEAFLEGSPESFAEVLLGAGVTVVDGGVEDVDAAVERGEDGLHVTRAGGFVRFTEVGAKTDGREQTGGSPAVKFPACERLVARGEARGAIGSAEAAGHEDDCNGLAAVARGAIVLLVL